jgi:hypothetical protein
MKEAHVLTQQADNAKARDLYWKPPVSPATITTRLVSVVAKNTAWTMLAFTVTTPAPALPTQQLEDHHWCNQGA